MIISISLMTKDYDLEKIEEADRMKQYGYVRVSAKDQNPERQILAMQEQQIKASDMYVDKISGQDFSRNSRNT